MEPEEMEKRFKGIEDSVGQITDSLKKVTEGLGGVVAKIETIGAKTPDDDGKKKSKRRTPDNLELISRAEFLGLIKDEIGDMLKEELGGVKNDFTEFKKDTSERNANQLLNDLKKRYPDFEDWKDEIIPKLKQGYNPEDAYQLARLSDPDKAKELDTKYEPEDVKKQREAEKKEKEEEKAKMGGLTPTSSRTIPSEKMTTDEAADRAWEKVFGGAEKV